MNRFYLPSRLFNPEFTTGTDARPSSDFLFDDSSDLSRATFGLSPGRVRDPVQGLLRSTYATQTTPDTLGFEDSGSGSGSDLLWATERARHGSLIKCGGAEVGV